MIMLASRILDTRPDARHLDAPDITVRRNAFGRQTDSPRLTLEFTGITDLPEAAAPLRGVFIARRGSNRWVPRCRCWRACPRGRLDGRADGRIVAVAQGAVVATSFHRRSPATCACPVLRRPGAALIRRGTAGG